MKWLKHALVDFFVTMMIVAAVIVGKEWLNIIVVGYTTFLLLIKVALYFNERYIKQLKRDPVPSWVFHFLYGINVIALLGFGWWITSGQWILIWFFSYLSQKKASTLKSKVAAR